MVKDLYKAQRTIAQEMWGESRFLHSAVETVEWLVKRDIKELPCSYSQSVLMSVSVYRIENLYNESSKTNNDAYASFSFLRKKVSNMTLEDIIF